MCQVLRNYISHLSEELNAGYMVQACKVAKVLTAKESGEIMALSFSNSSLVAHILSTVVKNGVQAYRLFLNVLKEIWRYSRIYQMMIRSHELAMVSYQNFGMYVEASFISEIP